MLRTRLAPLAAPAALALAGATVAAYRIDRAAAMPTLALALGAAVVLAVLAASDARDGWVVPGAAVAVAAALAFLPANTPLPTGVVGALLVLAIGLTASGRLARARPPALLSLAGLILAVELVARADRLLGSTWAPETLALLLVVPTAVAVSLRGLAVELPAAALALGLGACAAGPGWGWTGTAAVVAGALGARQLARAGRPAWSAAAAVAGAALPLALAGPAWLALAIAAAAAATLAPRPALARAGAGVLAGAALVALAAGALPWREERPLASVLGGAVARPFRVEAAPVSSSAVLLSASAPSMALPLAPRRTGIRFLEARSYLTNGAGLPCGTVAARIELTDGGRAAGTLELAVGRDTADWAARRPDVAAAAACAAPAPAWSWLAASGGYLGSTYRGRVELPPGAAADRVRLTRDPALPADVAVAIFWVGVER